MTCPRTRLIMRLISQELPLPEQCDLRKHLEICRVCAAAHSEMDRTWNALGDWQLDVSGIDLTERVLGKADAEYRRPVRPIRLAAYRTVPIRAAASIVLAVGLGIGTGHLIPTGKGAAVPEPAAALEGITEALELIGLASESATGLPLSLEPDETPTGEQTP